jgi:zinc protease
MPNKVQNPFPLDETILTPDKPNASFQAGLSVDVAQDDPEYAALLVGNYMLGGDFNSRIVARLRQREGVSYGAGSSVIVEPWGDRAGRFTASAIAAPENMARLERAFREELALALEHGFREDELKAAKAGLLQTRQIDRAEDFSLAVTLRQYLLLDRTLDWDRQLDERLARVTAAEVLAAMRKHLDPAKLSVVKAGDFGKVQP